MSEQAMTNAEAELRVLRKLKRNRKIRAGYGSRGHPLATVYRAALIRLLIDKQVERLGERQYRLTEKGKERLAQHKGAS